MNECIPIYIWRMGQLWETVWILAKSMINKKLVINPAKVKASFLFQIYIIYVLLHEGHISHFTWWQIMHAYHISLGKQFWGFCFWWILLLPPLNYYICKLSPIQNMKMYNLALRLKGKEWVPNFTLISISNYFNQKKV